MKQLFNKIQKEPIIGFNWGTLFHNAQMEFQNEGRLSKEALAEIIKKTPPSMLAHARFSGSAANSTLITEVGFGLQGGRWDAQLIAQSKTDPTQSYLFSAIETYKQLGCETMQFVFNTFNPYLGLNKLSESIDSLTLMRNNTNVIAIALGNENYLRPDIIGASGTPNLFERIQLAGNFWNAFSQAKVNAGIKKAISKYLDFLEFIVVPAIRKSGYTGMIGMDTHVNTCITWRYWNELLLDRNFYDYITPHLYATGIDNDSIEAEFEAHITDLNLKKKGLPIWVTEFGLSEKSSELLYTTEEVDAFIARFVVLFKKYGVERAYFHTLWNSKPTLYTYIK